MVRELPDVELGAHLHTTPDSWEEKIEAVLAAGCYRIDGALKGFGGCPMAKDDLTGNMPTENVIAHLDAHNKSPVLNRQALLKALEMSSRVMG